MSEREVDTEPKDRAKRIAEIRDRVYADYRERTPGSAALFERASQSLAGGVSGNLRYFDPYPLYTTAGHGCRVRDVDGAEYIDCFGGNGPLLLGHNHPSVVEAIDQHREGGSLPLNPDLMVECAELLKEIVPCAERVRFLNTGTEAVMTAIRCARAHTGRSKIIKFQGHYHGQNDQVLFALGPSRDLFSAGVPQAAIADMLALPFDDLEVVRHALAGDPDVAAVILDPAMHAGGLWGSRLEFLQGLRELTRQYGALLIFDEVITGFRVALGGAQAHFGVTPDLATFAKALAAGEKLSAVAGREEVMRVVDPNADPSVPRVFQSGTVNDGASALAAAIGAMRTYLALDGQGAYKDLAALGARLAEGLRSAFSARGVGCHINQLGSMLQMFLTDAPPSFANFHALDPTARSLFFHGLINEEVILTLPTSDHIYLSFAHTDGDIALILEKVDSVFERYRFQDAF
jgi:glutamate-1-semialdehyde 2,1-aminomutase